MNHTGDGPLIILICLTLLSSPYALAAPQQAIANSRMDVRAESKIAAGDRARLSGNYPLAQQQIMLGLKQIETSKSPSPERLAAAYNYLALLNNNMGQYRHSENNARKALAFATKAGLSENILSRHRVVLANALRQQGKYPEALSNLEQVTATLKNSTKDKVLFATATNNLGALYFWMGNYQKAQTILERGSSSKTGSERWRQTKFRYCQFVFRSRLL
jgi:tetratricopeptide (TPR) repeat protein